MLKPRKIRARLDARRCDLLDRYKGELERADEELATREAEPVDAATDYWDVRVLSAMSDRDATALAAVVAAIRRLDVGTYGKCVDCGHRIEVARLAAIPEAVRCTECIAQVAA